MHLKHEPSDARSALSDFSDPVAGRSHRFDHKMEHEMKSLPVAVIADPISGHLFSLPFATPTLRTAMSWQRSLDDLPAHRWLRGLVLRVIQTL
jgi:hypothetical protein